MVVKIQPARRRRGSGAAGGREAGVEAVEEAAAGGDAEIARFHEN
jgi:hypothetical protein